MSVRVVGAGDHALSCFEWFVLLMLCSRLDWPSYAGELWCSGFVCTVLCLLLCLFLVSVEVWLSYL
jgi:hypothetical protein